MRMVIQERAGTTHLIGYPSSLQEALLNATIATQRQFTI